MTKNYFLDTNIILDFLGNRKPFGKFAFQIFNKARLGEWTLWTSDNALTTAYSIISRKIGEAESRKKLSALLDYMEVQPVLKSQIQAALGSKFSDFEDGVQHYCALSIEGIDGIVTRNRKDFKFSQIPIFGPEQLFE